MTAKYKFQKVLLIFTIIGIIWVKYCLILKTHFIALLVNKYPAAKEVRSKCVNCFICNMFFFSVTQPEMELIIEALGILY